jgi:hypothetical protein
MKYLVRVILTVSAFVIVLGVAPLTAFAHNGEDHATERETRQHEATTLQGGSSGRLDENKTRACETRAQNINALMTRSVFRAENFGKLLATLTERVKAFSTTLSLGADADVYIASITAAQAKFDADFAALEAAATFSCDSDDPKGQIAAFQEAHRTIMQDIKNWRVAVKNFVSFLQSASGDGR